MVELRLVALVPKNQPINDIGEIQWKEVGDRRAIIVARIPTPPDFPVTNYQDWGAIFKSLSEKYASALNVNPNFVKVWLISG